MTRTTSKRNDYLNWDEYFMAISCLTSERTSEANDKAGACIVNQQNKILGVGYNGMPNGVDRNVMSNLKTKIGDICDSFVHAELNAVLNCTLNDQANCKMYITRFPCHECAKVILQSGIKQIFYEPTLNNDPDVNSSTKTASYILKIGGVKFIPLKLSIDLEEFLSIDLTNIRYNKHDYFMSVAVIAAQRSKDPSTQVGACIVNKQNKIIATGYNGMPNGVHDDLVPWTKEGSFLETKYAYVVHAELNAILNCVLTDQTSCRVYVTLFPCNECAKAIIQSGIRKIIYLSDKHCGKESTKAAKIMLSIAGVEYEQYHHKRQIEPSLPTWSNDKPEMELLINQTKELNL